MPTCEASTSQLLAYHGTAMRRRVGVGDYEVRGVEAVEKLATGECGASRDTRLELSLNAVPPYRRLLLPDGLFDRMVVDAAAWAGRPSRLPSPPTQPTSMRRLFAERLLASDCSRECDLARRWVRRGSERDDLSRVFPDASSGSTHPNEYLELLFPYVRGYTLPRHLPEILDGPDAQAFHLVADPDCYPLDPALGRERMGRRFLDRYGGFAFPGVTVLNEALADWLLADADLRYFPRYARGTLMPTPPLLPNA